MAGCVVLSSRGVFGLAASEFVFENKAFFLTFFFFFLLIYLNSFCAFFFFSNGRGLCGK